MNVPDNLKYVASHEWVRCDGDIGVVGITDFAQEEMTEIVYVELPEVGRTVASGEEVAVVESVKSASDIYAPISGEITEVNDALTDDPSLVNQSAFADGWMFKIRLSNPSELDGLLDADGYKAKISS